MERRIVTREEAEAAFTREFGGSPVSSADGTVATIEAVKLPDVPLPGGVAGKGFLPLTYVYKQGAELREVDTEEGPEIDEARAVMRVTLPDYQIDQRLEFWFEETWSPDDCGCGCGCD